MIGPKILRLLAIKCVDEAMVRDPVFADKSSGQGFHQANAVMQGAIGADCHAQRAIRPDTRILAFDFPRRMSGHVNMTFAWRSTRKNTGANDLLKSAPRRVVVDDAKLFCDLSFRQVWINRDPRVESSLEIFHRELVVKRDDLLDQWSCSHLLDEGLVMSLAGLHRGDAIRHVQGCQFPDNARLDSTHEPILCPQDQIQILLGQLGSESLLQVAVHALEVEVELVVELRRDVTVVGLQKLVVVTTQQTRNTLGELKVVVAQTSKISKARQFSAPDGELPVLASSRGEKVPLAVQPEAEVHPFPGEEHLQLAAPSWQSWGQAPSMAMQLMLSTSVEAPSVRLLLTKAVAP